MADDSISLKRLCITFNVILGLIGCIILTVGILVTNSDALQFGKHFQDNSIYYCVFGSSVILLALLGFYGAYKERKWPLRLYVGITAIEFICCVNSAFSLSSDQSENKSNQQTQPDKASNENQEMKRHFVLGLVCTFAFAAVISMILSLAMYCHIRDKTTTTPVMIIPVTTTSVTSCEDPQQPAYSVLYRGGTYPTSVVI